MAINDNKKTFYNNINVNDGEILWLVSQGIVRSTLPDMWRRYLITQGYTTGTIIDRLYSFFGSRGYTGTFSNRYNQFFLNLSDPGASTLSLLNSLQTETDGFVINWAQGNSGVIRAVDSTDTADQVSNGGFDTDTIWTKNGGATISGGVATLSAINDAIIQDIDIPEGRPCTVTFDYVTSFSGNLRIYTNGEFEQITLSGSGTYTHSVSSSGATNDQFQLRSNGWQGTLDNATCSADNVALDIQELTQQDTDILDYTSPSKKYVTGPDGNLRYAAHNLLRYSSQFDTLWGLVNNATVTEQSSEAGPGGDTGVVWELDTNGVGTPHIRQDLTSIEPSVSRTSYVYVKQAPSGSATHIRVSTNNSVAWNTGNSTKLALTSSWQKVAVSGTISSGTAYRTTIGTPDETGLRDTDCDGKILIAWAGAYNNPADSGLHLETTSVVRYAIPQTHDASKHTTSTSNLMLTLGEKAVTLATSQTYAVGDDIKIWNDDNNQMSGTVVSGSDTSYVIDVEHVIAGSGSKSSWHISPILGRLCEPATTNDLPYSEDFSHADWTKTGISLTSGQSAPNGESTAFLVTADAGTANHFLYDGVPSATRAHTIFAKAGTANWVSISSNSGQSDGVFFNISTGVVGMENGGSIGYITPYRDGYYRCEIVFSSAKTFCTVGIHTADHQAHNWNATGTETISIFGAQSEQTSNRATSYTHTAGSTVTRLADDVSKAASELPFADGAAGSHVSAFEMLDRSISPYLLSYDDGSTNNRHVIYTIGNTARQFIADGGSTEANEDIGTLTNADHKIAISWDVNRAQGALDGTANTEHTTVTLPDSITTLNFGQDNSTGNTAHIIQKYDIYRARDLVETNLELETAA